MATTLYGAISVKVWPIAGHLFSQIGNFGIAK